MAATPPTGSSPFRMPSMRGIRPGAVAVVVIAAAVLIWLLVRNGDDEKSAQNTTAAPARGGPALASPSRLSTLAADVGFPIYWAGVVPERKIELSQTSAGNVFIRYLTPDARAGDKRPRFLTIGTYPLRNAYAATENAAKRPGNTSRKLPRDGLVVSGANATNAYFAYPGSQVQVEVFSPQPRRALQLVTSGRIRAIPR